MALTSTLPSLPPPSLRLRHLWPIQDRLAEAGRPKPQSQTISSRPAELLEAQGWEPWLTTLFPFAFDEEFSADHRAFWDLYWSVLLRIRENLKYHAAGLPV